MACVGVEFRSDQKNEDLCLELGSVCASACQETSACLQASDLDAIAPHVQVFTGQCSICSCRRNALLSVRSLE